VTVTAIATAIATVTDGDPAKTPGDPPVSPGEMKTVVNPDFAEEIVLVAILGADRLGESVEIVDVRQDANELWVKVRIHPQSSRAILSGGVADGVVIRRDALSAADSLIVYFVDEFYQTVEAGIPSR